MFSNKLNTLLIITSDHIARVDVRLDRDIQIVAARTETRDASAELQIATRDAAMLSSCHSGSVWILSDDFWCGPVELDCEVVDALAGDQIEQALANEAEFDSGLSPFESKLAFHPLSALQADRKRWMVTQIECSIIDSICSHIPKTANRIAGFGPISKLKAHNDVEFDSQNHTAPTPNFSNNEQLESFAINWFKQLANDRHGGSHSLPIVRQTRPTWTAAEIQRLSTMFAAAALVLCVVMHWTGSRTIAALKSNLASNAAIEKQLKKDIGKIARTNQELAVQFELLTSKQNENTQRHIVVKRKNDQQEMQRSFPSDLLHTLANTARPEHQITHFTVEIDQMTLRGIAISSKAVTDLTQLLEEELLPFQWAVQPAAIVGSPDSSLVSFEITATPLSTPVTQIALNPRGKNDET